MEKTFTTNKKFLQVCSEAVKSALETRNKYGRHKNIHLVLAVFFAVLQLVYSFYSNRLTSAGGSNVTVAAPGSLLCAGFLGLYIRSELNYRKYNDIWENWKLLQLILTSQDSNQASVSQIISAVFAKENVHFDKKAIAPVSGKKNKTRLGVELFNSSVI